MAPRNPSELARQDAMKEDLYYTRRLLKEGIHSKTTKEYLLRTIRELERQLDLENVPYNSEKF